MSEQPELPPDAPVRHYVARHMEALAVLLRLYDTQPMSPIMREFLANNMASVGQFLLEDADFVRSGEGNPCGDPPGVPTVEA